MKPAAGVFCRSFNAVFRQPLPQKKKAKSGNTVRRLKRKNRFYLSTVKISRE